MSHQNLRQRLRTFLSENENRPVASPTLERTVAPSLNMDKSNTTMNHYVNNEDIDNISNNQNTFNNSRTINNESLYNSVSNVSNTSTRSTTNNSSSGTVDNSITFQEGAIQITMTNGNEADIDKLVKQIANKLKKEANLRSTLNYKPVIA